MDGSNLWIGNKLPTTYETAQTIFHYSKNIRSAKRASIINSYANAVRDMRIRSFDEEFVMSQYFICRTREQIMQDYEHRVRFSHNKSYLHVRNKLWKYMDIPEPKRKTRKHQEFVAF